MYCFICIVLHQVLLVLAVALQDLVVVQVQVAQVLVHILALAHQVPVVLRELLLVVQKQKQSKF